MHRNQIPVIEEAIEKIQENPALGDLKIGDLAGIRVHKFNIFHQLFLLAYTHDEQSDELMLISLASHANFYENLKKQIKSL